jgi:hypothetical protein
MAHGTKTQALDDAYNYSGFFNYVNNMNEFMGQILPGSWSEVSSFYCNAILSFQGPLNKIGDVYKEMDKEIVTSMDSNLQKAINYCSVTYNFNPDSTPEQICDKVINWCDDPY